MIIRENKNMEQAGHSAHHSALQLCFLVAAFFLVPNMLNCAVQQRGPLRDRLQSPDAQTKESAFKEFDTLSHASKRQYLEIMTSMLKENDPNNQVLAVDALGRMGHAAEEAVPDLVQLLSVKNDLVRSRAGKALAEIGEVAVPSLITALNHQDKAVRIGAADVLGSMGPAAKEAVPPLANLLGDEDQEIARHAASALGRIGPAAVPELIEVARWRGRNATDMASTAFANLKADASTVRELVKLMGNVKEDPEVRAFAAKALGNMPDKARGEMPELIRVLGDENNAVRTAARWALSQTGPKGIPALREALKNSNPRIRAGAAFALGSMGPAAEEAVPDLLGALKDEDRTVRIDAVLALGKTRVTSDTVVRALIQVLETDKDEVVQLDAVRVLSKIDKEEAKDALAKYNTKSGQQ